MRAYCLSIECSEQLSTVDDNAVSWGLTRRGWTDSLKIIEDIHTTGDLTEDDVLAIEMGGSSEAKEELGAVGVGTSVGHGEDTSAGVFADEVLVFEFASVDRLATSAITSGEVTTLGHEAWDDSVELWSLEMSDLAWGALSRLTSAESAEVLSSTGNLSDIQSDGNSLDSSATDLNVEVNLTHIDTDFWNLKKDY